jgi:NAD(P)-dependent dehydrogenase (short-subunit alcohol dehydrogenase family)
LVLVGRSRLPEPEPPEVAALADRASLRNHLIQTMRRDNPAVLPAEIERALLRILKDRQIRANLEEMQRAGSSIEYHAVDVRDPEQFGTLIDRIYDRHGQLDGVLHGAGVIADSLIGQKSLSAFSEVVATKVQSALVFSEKLRRESLKFFVLFSSISGRFGNAGQIDYSAANEYLNKLAAHLDAQWPGRVVAVNWGPWNGGMVSDELRRLYQRNGMELIPLEGGSRALLDELAHCGAKKPEVLLACNMKSLAAAAGVGVRG